MKSIRIFQILRLLAFLGICLGHFGANVIIPSHFASWGVTVFFVLSGFLNISSRCKNNDSASKLICAEDNPIKFAILKIRKNYVLVVITTMFAFLLDSFHFWDEVTTNVIAFTIKSFFRLTANLLLISDWLPKNEIFFEYNIVVWFLSCLFLFYIFTPFFIKTIKKRLFEIDGKVIWKRVITSTLVLYFVVFLESELYCVFFYKRSFFTWLIYENPFVRIGDYLLGMVVGALYFLSRKIEISRIQATVFLCLSIVFTGLFIYFDIHITFPGLLLNYANGVYYTFPTLCLVYSLCVFEKVLSNSFFSNKIIYSLIRLGDLTAYAYLIHVPVINLIHGILRRTCFYNIYLWFGISMVFIYLMSVLYEKLFVKRIVSV